MITVSHSKINNVNKLRLTKALVLAGLFLLISLKGLSQPSETIYLGNVIKSGYSDEESFGPFNIGFNFTFFGNANSQFYVSSNGLVLFGAGSTDGNEVSIPNAAEPNNFIAPLWDDLIISSSGKMLYATVGTSPNRKLIIQGMNMGFYPNPIFMGTYLVILYEGTNKIQIQYRIIIDGTSERAHGGSATIGIENPTGSDGKLYAYHNPAAISTGKAISFTPSGPAYIMDSDAMYDGVVLTTNLTLPEPGIPQLLSPPQNAVIGSDYNFQWSESGNSATYTPLISHFSDIGGAKSYNAGSNLSYNVTGLTLDTTYYWGVFATNATGTTWCEIQKFTTSSAPPLEAVPQTVWVEQGQDKTIQLNYTGGNASSKTAIITSLPVHGQLYQYNAGVRGSSISSLNTTVSDAEMKVIYAATGGPGNGVGNFNYLIHEPSKDSPPALITVNVSPPGIPNLLFLSKSTGIELQFDKIMANPSGSENQFIVTVNSSQVAISSLTIKEGDPYSIIATLPASLLGTETVTISYSGVGIASAQGGLLLPFSEQTISLRAQTITFNALPPKQDGDPPFLLSATASSGLSLTYSSSNLAIATISGNTVTIHSAGTTDITARQAGNGIYAPARYTRSLTITGSTLKTLHLTSVFLQGLYNGTSTMRQAYDELGAHWPAGVADHITVELHSASNYAIIYTSPDVPLSTTGIATITVPAGYSDSYYITVRHRNSMQTVSSTAKSFAGTNISQSFATPADVFGGNLVRMTDHNYAIYGGDVNQDNIIDLGDSSPVDNKSALASSGYIPEDVNGDGLVDLSDAAIIDNNAAMAIGSITP